MTGDVLAPAPGLLMADGPVTTDTVLQLTAGLGLDRAVQAGTLGVPAVGQVLDPTVGRMSDRPDDGTATDALQQLVAGPTPERADAAGSLHDPVIGLVLGLAWAVVVAVAAAGALRRSVRRLPEAADEGRDDSRPARGDGPAPVALVQRVVGELGAAVRRGAAPLTPPSRPPGSASGSPARPGLTSSAGTAAAGATAPADVAASVSASAGALGHDHDDDDDHERAADRRTGWAALASGFLLLVAPALAAAPVTWAVAAPVLAARRGHARHEAALADQLPDVVDLLALTTAAGLPVAGALVAIGARPGGPLGDGLARAGAHVRHGGSTAEALALLAATGPSVRPLVDALVQHDRYGTPLLPALERVGIEARARRRRRCEEAARKLPVTLLFPLVLTTFPAFVLLTVVPLLAGSLGSLSLSPT